ncbi:hypothetical protein II906_09375 [bacterium]|nr:hypothetical protein [bacterium]
MTSSQIGTNSTNKAGLCPHGLPPSACPICSGGMAGGGKKMQDVATKPMKASQWSYMKCYAAGIAMRAQENRVQNAKNFIEKQFELADKIRISMNNFRERISEAMKKIQNSFPPVIANTARFVMNIFVNPILNFANKIPELIEKFANFQKNAHEIIKNIQDKIAAVLGDIKNFIQRKIVDNFRQKAKKFFLFFMSNIEDENYQNDDTLFVFKSREMKKYLIKFVSNIIKRDKSADNKESTRK